MVILIIKQANKIQTARYLNISMYSINKFEKKQLYVYQFLNYTLDICRLSSVLTVICNLLKEKSFLHTDYIIKLNFYRRQKQCEIGEYGFEISYDLSSFVQTDLEKLNYILEHAKQLKFIELRKHKFEILNKNLHKKLNKN